jgi:hypothetical protein
MDKLKDKIITIVVNWSRDEEKGVDIYDTEYAREQFEDAIEDYETYNDMIIEGWNEEQRDYMNDQR